MGNIHTVCRVYIKVQKYELGLLLLYYRLYLYLLVFCLLHLALLTVCTPQVCVKPEGPCYYNGCRWSIFFMPCPSIQVYLCRFKSQVTDLAVFKRKPQQWGNPPHDQEIGTIGRKYLKKPPAEKGSKESEKEIKLNTDECLNCALVQALVWNLWNLHAGNLRCNIVTCSVTAIPS